VNNAINTLSNGWFYSSTVPYGTVGVVLLGDLGGKFVCGRCLRAFVAKAGPTTLLVKRQQIAKCLVLDLG
jgi:hypothetical protein